MSPPLDLQEDLSPVSVLESVPNRSALKRVIEETNGIPIPDTNLGLEDFIGDLNSVEVRQLVSEIKFAHQNHIYYYQVPGLEAISLEATHQNHEQRTGMVGAEVIWVSHEHNRTYIGCSVPEESGQQQLGWTDETRETAICVVNPESNLLGVRAGNSGSAAGAHRAVCDYAEIDSGEKVSPRILEGDFSNRAVEKYRSVEFASSEDTSPIADLTITTDYTEEVTHELFDDDVVETVGNRADIGLDNARVDLSLLDGETVTISYHDSSIEFHRFVPESWLLNVDDAIAAALA